MWFLRPSHLTEIFIRAKINSMNRTRLILIASPLAIIASIFTFSYFQKGSNEPQNTINTTVEPKDTAQIPETTPAEPKILESDLDTNAWKTYRNDEFGFEVKYPERILDVKVTKEYHTATSGNALVFGNFTFKLKEGPKDITSQNTRGGFFEIFFNNPDPFNVTLGNACVKNILVGQQKIGRVCYLDGEMAAAQQKYKEFVDIIEKGVCVWPGGTYVHVGKSRVLDNGMVYTDAINVSCEESYPNLTKIYQKMYQSIKFTK